MFVGKDEMFSLLWILLASLHHADSGYIRGALYGRDWAYDSILEPKQWRGKYENCGGKNQSPINIDVSKVRVNSSLGRVFLHGFKEKRVYTIANIGSTVLVTPAAKEPPIELISEDGKERYHLLSAHFHWTSEHAMNGQYYALECHMVMYNEKYKDLLEALEYADGLEVVSTMFALSPYANNPRLNVLTDAVAHILEPDFSVNVTMALEEVLPTYISAYFRYHGSLTIPTCDEVVTWTVFYPPNYIGPYQLKLFRYLHRVSEHNKVTSWRKLNNRRPLQPLNDRHVEMFTTSYAPLYAG